MPKYLYRHKTKPAWRLYNPVTAKYSYLSDAKYTKAQAFAEAARVGELAKVGHPDSLGILIPRYLKYLEQTPNKPSTLAVKRSILGWYLKAWGQFRARDVDRGVLMEHWETIGPHGWQKHRSIWSAFLDWCEAHNYVNGNEAKSTLPPPKLERVTHRHTAKGIALIRAKAEPWLQIAIDLAIYSLQDRSTLLAAKRHDIAETEQGYVWELTRTKVTKHLSLSIPKGSKLHSALQAALNNPVMGDYLIRRSAGRKVRTGKRDNWSQVLPDYLSKQFAKARQDAYPDLTREEQPGFHQLRAWGSHLYRQAGFDTDYVQALMAHERKQMTQNYQEGHGVVERVDVEAGL